MKVLDFIPKAKSAEEFFKFYHDSKFLIFDRSRVEEINLLEMLQILSREDICDYEYRLVRSCTDIDSYYTSEINSAFRKSIGVVELDNYLDDFYLFESEKALEEYVDDYRFSYLKDSIAFEVTSEMIDELLEEIRLNRIASLKETIDLYQKSIDDMTKELEELEKI